MFSNGLPSIAVAAALLGASVPVTAEPMAVDGNGPGTLDSPIRIAYLDGSDAHRPDVLIDRSEIESMPELVSGLLDVIARLSKYERPATMPRVFKVSRDEIERTICQGHCMVKAWHMPGEGIFLDASLSPETNLIHRSILLHELVHYVQDLNAEGVEMDDCNRWLHREREAYELQNDYLALVASGGTYQAMLANKLWVASHRNTCRSARTDAVAVRQ